MQVCEYCDFTSRYKIDFKDHSSHHPKCTVCKKSFVNDQSLIEHMESHSTTKCNKCGIDVPLANFANHVESHNLVDNYKNTLNGTKGKKRKQPGSGEPKQIKLNSFVRFCQFFRKEKKRMFPNLSMLGINEKLREDWRKLTPEEKASFKEGQEGPTLPVTNTSVPEAPVTAMAESFDVIIEPQPLEPTTSADVPLLSNPIRPDLSVSSANVALPPQPIESAAETSDKADAGQTFIIKCNVCGKLFFNKLALDKHVEKSHNEAIEEGNLDTTTLSNEAPNAQVNTIFWFYT